MTYITSAPLIILFVATLRQQNAKNTIVYTSEIGPYLKIGCKLGCKSVQNSVQNVQKATVSHYEQNADRALFLRPFNDPDSKHVYCYRYVQVPPAAPF